MASDFQSIEMREMGEALTKLTMENARLREALRELLVAVAGIDERARRLREFLER